MAGTATKGIWFRETHDRIHAVELLEEMNCLGRRTVEEQGLRRRQAEINAHSQEPFCLTFLVLWSDMDFILDSMSKDISMDMYGLV